MTAAEQQISGNPAAMENAQARTTVTDQAKVQDIISRMDRAHETPMFHRIVTLVAAGMLMDSIDVYIGSAVASSALATHWSTVAQNSTFMSAGFLGLLVGSLLAGFVGDLKGRRVAYQINLLLFGGFTFLGAFAPNMAVLSLCRLGAGLGLGAEIVTGLRHGQRVRTDEPPWPLVRDCLARGQLRCANRYAAVCMDHPPLGPGVRCSWPSA